jgi:hypothetical protein
MAKENGQRTNKDLQNIVFKTKDRVARTPINTGSCSQYNNQNAYIKSRFLYSTLVFIPLLGAVSSPYLFLLISITTKQHMIVIGARTSVNWGSCYSIFSFKYNVL